MENWDVGIDLRISVRQLPWQSVWCLEWDTVEDSVRIPVCDSVWNMVGSSVWDSIKEVTWKTGELGIV